VELASANLGLNLLSFFAQWLRQGSLLRLSLFANAAFTLDYPGCSAQVQYKKHNCHVEKWHPLVGIGVSHGNLPRQSIERSQYAELLKPRDFRNQESYLPLVMNQILKRNLLLVVIAKNQPELGTHPGKPGHPLDACFRRHDERLQSESLNQGISHRRPSPNVLLNNLRRGDFFSLRCAWSSSRATRFPAGGSSAFIRRRCTATRTSRSQPRKPSKRYMTDSSPDTA
jgi:hypothetical protein